MALSFKIKEIAFNKKDYSFLQIGALAKKNDFTIQDFKLSKKEKIDGLWGTLGWADDRPLTASGEINFSENGCDTHRGVTKELAEIIMKQNPDVQDVSQIRERFIDLSSVEFKNLPRKIKKEEEIHLRFELFLDKTEGALVYLQDNPKGVMNSKHSLVNFITPEPTPRHTQNRTSLTYHFAYSFGRELEYLDGEVIVTDKPKVMPSVLKILTFVRTPLPPQEYFKMAAKNLNTALAPVGIAQAGLNVLGDKKYKLFLYNTNKSEFSELSDTSSLNKSAKTLLLFHGTFSSVDGTFGELCHATVKDGNRMISPFTKLINDGVFDQIIGFNHPTASQSVDENVSHFCALMSGFRFSKPVHMMTTSRGALVAESIITHPAAASILSVDRIMTFAPAHGSDLLKVAKGLDRFLSFLKLQTSAMGWGYVIALAQFSIKAISTQPGLNDMLPNSDKIKSVLNATPNNTVRIRAMVGDYDKSLISKPAARILANGADALIRLAFRSETDWVIGCPEQQKRITHPNASYDPDFHMYCIHGLQFKPGHAKKEDKDVDMIQEIKSFFG
jgi:hypothetical protein